MRKEYGQSYQKKRAPVTSIPPDDVKATGGIVTDAAIAAANGMAKHRDRNYRDAPR